MIVKSYLISALVVTIIFMGTVLRNNPTLIEAINIKKYFRLNFL